MAFTKIQIVITIKTNHPKFSYVKAQAPGFRRMLPGNFFNGIILSKSALNYVILPLIEIFYACNI